MADLSRYEIPAPTDPVFPALSLSQTVRRANSSIPAGMNDCPAESSLNDQLLHAVVSQQFYKARFFILEGADINIDGGRPLVEAVRENDFDFVLFCLDHGADVRSSDDAAIRMAVEMRHKAVCEQLLAGYEVPATGTPILDSALKQAIQSLLAPEPPPPGKARKRKKRGRPRKPGRKPSKKRKRKRKAKRSALNATPGRRGRKPRVPGRKRKSFRGYRSLLSPIPDAGSSRHSDDPDVPTFPPSSGIHENGSGSPSLGNSEGDA